MSTTSLVLVGSICISVFALTMARLLDEQDDDDEPLEGYNAVLALSTFEGHFDPAVYIVWELEVDAEFAKYDLSEKQMIVAIACALTKFALTRYIYHCRHNPCPSTWHDFKLLFRYFYIPTSYADELFHKLTL